MEMANQVCQPEGAARSSFRSSQSKRFSPGQLPFELRNAPPERFQIGEAVVLEPLLGAIRQRRRCCSGAPGVQAAGLQLNALAPAMRASNSASMS